MIVTRRGGLLLQKFAESFAVLHEGGHDARLLAIKASSALHGQAVRVHQKHTFRRVILLSAHSVITKHKDLHFTDFLCDQVLHHLFITGS